MKFSLFIIASLMWSQLVLYETQQVAPPQPRLQIIACAASSNSANSYSPNCLQYYSGRQVSWYAAHATCYSQGLTLASIPADLGILAYSPEWIAANRIWERPGDEFVESLFRNGVARVWLVNAHMYWYGTRGPALANGTQLHELNGLTTNYKHADEHHNCVILTAHQFHFQRCSDVVEGEVFFACVPRSQPNQISNNSHCSLGWTSAKVNGIYIGKCFKEVPTDNYITWDKARGICFDEAGDILSINNDAERVWFENFTRNLKSNSMSNKDILIFMNLHELLYCNTPADWCWSNRIRQQEVSFPQWNSNPQETNNVEGSRGFEKDCGVFKIAGANPSSSGLNDIGCNSQYSGGKLKFQVRLICDTKLIQPLSINIKDLINSKINWWSSILFILLMISVAVAVIFVLPVSSYVLFMRTRATHKSNSHSTSQPNDAPSPTTPTIQCTTTTKIQAAARNKIPVYSSSSEPQPTSSVYEYTELYGPLPERKPLPAATRAPAPIPEHALESIYDSESIQPIYDTYGSVGPMAEENSNYKI